jgi:hypothetical protein
MEEQPFVLGSPGSRNAEMTLGHFSHFAFRGFEMQWKSNPLFLEVLVAEMPHHFMILVIRYELMRYTPHNSVPQTYLMTIDPPHLWILSVENKLPTRLILSPKWTSYVCCARRS